MSFGLAVDIIPGNFPEAIESTTDPCDATASPSQNALQMEMESPRGTSLGLHP
jgi:hypothetical protein